MSGMIPLLYDEELSTLILGDNFKTPGKVTLSGHDRIPVWDDQAAKGSTGASTTLNDPKPPGKFQARFELAHDSFDDTGENDFDRWETCQRMIEATTSGPKPFALPIYHPDLARNGFTEVTNGGISGMTYDGRGGAVVTVTFKEYRPAKPKPAAKPTAKPGASTAGGTQKPDPNAAAKAELAQLLAEAKRP